MTKYPCYVNTTFCNPCVSKGFYLQQIQGQGYLKKNACQYTIFTECGNEFTNTNAIQSLEICGESTATILTDCKKNEILVRVRIPLLLHLCSCSCPSTEKGYIEDIVPVKFCGNKEDLWHCQILANSCVRLCKNHCRIDNHSPVSMSVQIQVLVLCGCIVHSVPSCACSEQKPWYPPPFPCNIR